MSPASGAYIPDRGDAIWLEFNPQAGHERAGRRPALVLSPCAYNALVGLALVCPIATQVKGYPFEVVIPDGARISAKISQAVFARRLNTSASTVEKWETGAKRPSGVALKRLAVVKKHGLAVLD